MVFQRKVSRVSSQDLQGSRVTYSVMALLSVRVQIASGSLELLVQQDVLRLAKSYGFLWLDHFCLKRALEDRVEKHHLDCIAACACWPFCLSLFMIFSYSSKACEGSSRKSKIFHGKSRIFVGRLPAIGSGGF